MVMKNAGYGAQEGIAALIQQGFALTNNNPGYGLVPGDSNPTPPIVSRYFAWNETTRYATIPEVTLAGDFSGVVQFATTSASQSTVFSGVSSNESSVIVDVKPGEVRFFAYNSGGELVGVVVFSGSYNDGVLHNVAFSLSGANASLSVDGGEPVIAAWVGYDTASIGVLYQRADGTGSFKGIIANLRIWDNSTLIRDYPIDDDSNTLVDHASGQDGSVINGIQADWGLFEEQSTGEWLGQELVVNGGFDSDSNWILGVGWSISDNAANHTIGTGTSNQSIIQTPDVIVSGRNYRWSYETLNYSEGSVHMSNSGSVIAGSISTGNGILKGDSIFSNTGLSLRSSFSLDFDGSVGNVSVKEVLNVA